MSAENIQFWEMLGTWAAVLVAGLTSYLAWNIGKRQNEINQNILNLSYSPSTEVSYVLSKHELHIANKSNSNLWAWGMRMGNRKSIEEHGRLIPPGSAYFLPCKDWEEFALKNENQPIEFELLVTDQNKQKYIIRNQLHFDISDQRIVNTRCQTLFINREDWS